MATLTDDSGTTRFEGSIDGALPVEWTAGADGSLLITLPAPPTGVGFTLRVASEPVFAATPIDGSGTQVTVSGFAGANDASVNIGDEAGQVAIQLRTTTGIRLFGGTNAGDLLFNAALDGSVTSFGGFIFPTADPLIAGAWWDNAGVLTKSMG